MTAHMKPIGTFVEEDQSSKRQTELFRKWWLCEDPAETIRLYDEMVPPLPDTEGEDIHDQP